MKGSINQVTLHGRAGQDAESKSWKSGDKYVLLSIVTEESWKDRESGEWKSKSEWHRIQVQFSHTTNAEAIKKGSMVFVMGQKATNVWKDATGLEKSRVEIHVKSPGHTILETSPPRAEARSASVSRSTSGDYVDDDEIPF